MYKTEGEKDKNSLIQKQFEITEKKLILYDSWTGSEKTQSTKKYAFSQDEKMSKWL